MKNNNQYIQKKKKLNTIVLYHTFSHNCFIWQIMIGRLSLSDKSIIFLIIHNLLHRVIVKKKMCVKMCSTNIIKKNKGKQNYKVDL